MPRRATVLVSALAAVAALGWASMRVHAQIAVQNQGYIPFSDAPINYRSNDLSDPVAILQRQLDQGRATLVYESQFGYLRSVLKLLDVPADSQTLVFSKTSFQYPKISPEHPRALYFNDNVYVGKVYDGKALEIVSFDPRQGAIFYLLDEHRVARPVFQRAELDCTQCHIAAGTRGIPGVLLRSVYATATGALAPGTRSFITDQQSPFSQRWGGWYVTGYQGGERNMGNAAVGATAVPANTNTGGTEPAADPFGPSTESVRLAALGRPYDPSAYLFQGSDVVALLLLAHQTQMHNLITLTNYDTRLALYGYRGQGGNAQAPAGSPPDAGSPADAGSRADASAPAATTPAETAVPDEVRQRFERPAEQLLRYMLFVNETPLSGGVHRIDGDSAFAREFQARGIRDPKGRSLRDFDLKTRIFRYPCSYLIYSDSFDAIPEPAKGYIYHRLLQILSGSDQSADFAGLSGADREAILEILLATKPGLPEEWRVYARVHHLPVADMQTRTDTRGQLDADHP